MYTNDFPDPMMNTDVCPDPTSNMHTNTNTDVFVCPVKRNTSARVNVFINDPVNEPPKFGHFDKIKMLMFLTGNTMTTTLYWGYLQPFCKGAREVFVDNCVNDFVITKVNNTLNVKT